MAMDEVTAGLLKDLCEEIYKTTKISIDSQKTGPFEEIYTQWIYSDFKYTESGVSLEGVHSNEFVKPTWERAHRYLFDVVISQDAFKKVDEQLQNQYSGLSNIKQAANNFVSIFLQKLLEDIESFKTLTYEITNRLLYELLGNQMRLYSTVFIQGVIINCEPIKLNKNVVLRKITKEELEKPVRAMSHLEKPISPFDNFSACFDIEIPLTKNPWVNLHSEIEKNISILRLFCIASIYKPIYTMQTDSILYYMAAGPIRSIHIHNSFVSNVIRETDRTKLVEFYNRINLPDSLYNIENKESSHLKVSFERYKESLLENGTMERRIATVVMGMEALFSEGGAELTYKLSTRGSKLFGFILGNPKRYRELLKDAYVIRSSFAHGDILSKKQTNKLQFKYGENLKNILLEMADILRITIIIYIQFDKTKSDLISLIDNALIDSSDNNRLEQELLLFKKLI